MIVQFILNKKKRRLDVHPMERLLDVIRGPLRLTGTKEGCGEGECGACSVVVDGELVNACLIPVAQVAGRKVTTIEGIQNTRLKNSFVKCGGAQCGICTPGMVVAASVLLNGRNRPSEGVIREYLSGNLCRCTGYQHIVDSVRDGGIP